MKNIICSVLLSVMALTSVQAKWISYEDAPIKVAYDQEINVNSDGTTQELRKIQFEILKEPGRDFAANYTIRYNGANEKIKILMAKTVYQGQEYPIAENLIEDKPLASSHGGFDQKRQILLAFPKAEIGAKMYLEYSVITTEVPVPDFYAAIFGFGNREFVDKAHIKLHSQLPLHILVNDPEKALKITKDKKDDFHKLEIVLTKPLYKEFINETNFNVIDSKYLTWVSVSSLTKWKDLAVRFAQQYAKVFTQPLPKDFVKIAAKAAQKKDAVAQINTVTSLLNDKIQYMGDWRTIQGGYVPRDLDKISATQLGDCKDFSAATAAILTKLGYKAQIILARRGIGNFYPKSLPDVGAFNHALVKVTDKKGKVYWIDPTNFQSMAGGIFPDIADKMALILDQEHPGYEKIANINSEYAQVITKRQIEIINDNKIIESGKITLKNEKAYNLTGITLKISAGAVKDFIYSALSGSRLEEKNKKKLQLPDLKSRIVKDIVFNYSFAQENGILKTNLGQALKLTYDLLVSFFDVSQDYVTDVLVEAPFTYSRQTVIKNINVQNITSLNKEIKTPWLYVSRQCSLHKHDLRIDDTIIIYKNLIANADLKTAEFIALKDGLEKDFRDVAVVFNRRS